MIYQWAVIGAGPAGIACVGCLLDRGVDPQQIFWADPAFLGGDFGQKWRAVSSNTTVRLFIDFLKVSSSFRYEHAPDFPINNLNSDQTCLLKEMADPLQWISNHLREIVVSYQGKIDAVDQVKEGWCLKSLDERFYAQKVILAIGSEAKTLDYDGLLPIAVEDAMDCERLKKVCRAGETIAVIGSSHTAIIALYNLTALGVNIVNVYRSSLLYAEQKEGWILYDNTGLKGYSAQWARENLDEAPLGNIQRIQADDRALMDALKRCKKVIYAIGFERRQSLCVNGCTDFAHNPKTGEIAPGLFGFGIAFPEGKYDPAGNYEYRVGLWKFMDYLQTILPVWMDCEEANNRLHA